VSSTDNEAGRLRLQLDEMTAELLDRYEELTLLHDLGAAFASKFDVADICEVAIDRATRAIGSRKAAVALLEGDAVKIVASRDLAKVTPGGVTEYVARTGREMLLLEGEPPPPGIERALDRRVSVLCVPLVAPDGEEILGALTLAAKPEGDFNAGDAKLAKAIASQLATALYTSRVVGALRSAEGVRRELEIASGIQRAMLPAAPPKIQGASLGALCVPASNVGGDYYDFLVDGDGRVSLVIADVAGHSIGSALMMAMARSILRREITAGKAPADVLAGTNSTLYDDLVASGLFITMFCGRFEPERRILEYANAGHNPPLLRRADGRFEELDADGAALGILAEVVFEGRSVALGAGDGVLLYTDGITETANPDGVQFGEERLKAAFVADAFQDLPDLLYRAARSYAAGVSQTDDLTLVSLHVDAK
jgi:serine phosphatase RsbU (regulator of sigma subunit)